MPFSLETITTAVTVTLIGLAATSMWRLGGVLVGLPDWLSRIEVRLTNLEDLVGKVERHEVIINQLLEGREQT